MAQEWKWKERRIAWCADKGEPSERLATHHTAAVADPERREALISPDSSRWNSAAQSRWWLDVCKCVCGKYRQQQWQQCCRPPPCFEFDTVVPGREVWLVGPSYGKQSGVLKEGKEVSLKQIIFTLKVKILMVWNLCAVYVPSLTSIRFVMGCTAVTVNLNP